MYIGTKMMLTTVYNKKRTPEISELQRMADTLEDAVSTHALLSLAHTTDVFMSAFKIDQTIILVTIPCDVSSPSKTEDSTRSSSRLTYTRSYYLFTP